MTDSAVANRSVPAELQVGPGQTLDASTPMLLGAGSAWFLQAGEVDLFVVPDGAVDGTDATTGETIAAETDRGTAGLGRRCYIGSAVAGCLLLGSEPYVLRQRRWQLLAVGVAASVAPLDRGWASALPTSGPLQQGLYAWLTVTGRSLPASGPRTAVPDPDARSGGRISLTPGQVLTSPSGLRWCQDGDAGLALGGLRPATDIPIPLGASPCLEVTEKGSVHIRRTDQIDPTDLRRGTEQLQATLLAAHAGRAVARADRMTDREAGREQQNSEVRASALATFDQIDATEPWRPEASSDPILAACRLLGRVSGIAISEPPAWSRGLNTDPIRAVARASGVRVRTVTLEQGWWRHSLEPMLAFTEPDGDPVVLVPRRSGYSAVDPRTGARATVSEDSAGRLRPTAYLLYRPMPPGALTVRGLLRFGLHRSRPDVARLLIYSLVAGLLSLALPVATGIILGSLVPVGLTGQFLVAILLLLSVTIATTGFLLSRSAALLRLQGGMLFRMQSGLWDRLIALPVRFFRRFSVADLTMRVNAVDAIQQIFASVASQTLLSAVTLVFSLGLLFFYNVQLALVVLLATAITVSVSAVLTVLQIRRLREMYDAKGAASGVLLQIVQGLDKIRAAAAENRALGAWAARFADQAAALLSSERLSAVRTAIYAMLPSFLIVVVFAGVSTDPTMMTTGAVLAFITALGQIAAATAQLDLTLGYALNVLPLFDRMKPILAEPVEVSPGSDDPGLLTGRLELSSVGYRYPGMDRAVLHDVTITAEPGQFIALVGPSGSGKSTIVRLLLGFDRPESGTVSYDGKDLSTLDARAVRAQIGVALQNASVTGATLLSVITGDWPLTESDAWAAAAKVGLADDIRALPMGMQTMVGDNAVTFSGGQRQRLVLAAAIARNPRMVILDEATSALDSVTQARVSESFEQLQVTRVVVAHRLGTIRNADRIYVLDGGRVVQQGRFEELASTAGIFQNMVRRQTL